MLPKAKSNEMKWNLMNSSTIGLMSEILYKKNQN